ncbi:MAG TPA: P-loop NTPase [Acidimicrobiales bacterium]|nr:P-loop NTPase [Acidimicrobiales bacterium]
MAGDSPIFIGVCSGKGGVGKSTVTVNLALALRDLRMSVGVIDADFYGPDIPRMLNITRKVETRFVTLWDSPQSKRGRPLSPVECLGIKVVSAQFLMGEAQSFAVTGGFAGMLLDRFVNHVDWTGTDVVLIDLPPGTADLQQRATALPGMAGCLVVTTPQDVSHLDARKLLSLLRYRGVRVLGGVENMAAFRCPCCDAEIALFRPTPPDRAIWSASVPNLASIPFHTEVTDADHSGVPVVERAPDSAPASAFADLARHVSALIGG